MLQNQLEVLFVDALHNTGISWLVFSTFYVDSSNSSSFTFSSLLALDTTELVSQPVTQMAAEMININLISVQQKR